MTEASEPNGTVSRAVRILAAIADAGGEIGVNQVAERLALAPSTAHRLLRLLRQEGLVEWNATNHLYRIGREFYRISARVVEAVELPQLARPFIEELAAQFNETVLLGLHLETQRALSFAARADGEHMLQYRIEMHRPLSLVWGASGKAVLAFLPEEQIRAIVAVEGPAPASGRAAPTYEELLPELQKVQASGFCISEGEKLVGARGIAAPVIGPLGVVGSICLTSPKDRLPRGTTKVIAEAVKATAGELSVVLGAGLAASNHASNHASSLQQARR